MNGSDSEQWKVTPEYLDLVHEVGESVIRFMERADETAIKSAEAQLRADVLRHKSDPAAGYFKVLSKGRKKWEGHTLAGALTAAVSGGYPPPVRVIRYDDEGNRSVVLVYEGERDG